MFLFFTRCVKLKTDFEYTRGFAICTAFQNCFIENLPSPNANSLDNYFKSCIALPMSVNVIAVQFHNLEFSKKLYKTSRMHYFDYQIIFCSEMHKQVGTNE